MKRFFTVLSMQMQQQAAGTAIFYAAADVSAADADADCGDQAACGGERKISLQDRGGGGQE
jgi:hypothetical protein